MHNGLYAVVVLYLLCDLYGLVAVKASAGTEGYAYVVGLKIRKNFKRAVDVSRRVSFLGGNISKERTFFLAL